MHRSETIIIDRALGRHKLVTSGFGLAFATANKGLDTSVIMAID